MTVCQLLLAQDLHVDLDPGQFAGMASADVCSFIRVICWTTTSSVVCSVEGQRIQAKAGQIQLRVAGNTCHPGSWWLNYFTTGC